MNLQLGRPAPVITEDRRGSTTGAVLANQLLEAPDGTCLSHIRRQFPAQSSINPVPENLDPKPESANKHSTPAARHPLALEPTPKNLNRALTDLKFLSSMSSYTAAFHNKLPTQAMKPSNA